MKYAKGFFVFLAILALCFAYQAYYLKEAHSTFENYYVFRGCTSLVEKTDEYGICKTESGETIKIVKFKDAWYLDGDLPCGFLCF